MTGYEKFHLHVGYYEDDHDLEGILFKVKNQPQWILYFNADVYDLSLKDEYKREEPFGFVVREYNIKEINDTIGNNYFKKFLLEEGILST